MCRLRFVCACARGCGLKLVIVNGSSSGGAPAAVYEIAHVYFGRLKEMFATSVKV